MRRRTLEFSTASRILRTTGIVAVLFSLAACVNSNTIAQREVEAQKIPPHIKEFARALVVPISDLAHAKKTHSAGTAQLLPSGDFLTAAHVLKSAQTLNKSIAIYIDGSVVHCTVVDLHPHFVSQNDFIFASDTPLQDSVVIRPRYLRPTSPSAYSTVDPDSIELRLMDPLRSRIRFDSARFVPKGTTLYAFGYIYAPDRDNEEYLMPLVVTVVRGEAAADASPEQAIEMHADTELNVHGMSGGSIALYDHSTDELVVVGVLSCSKVSWRSLISDQASVILSSRLPPQGLTGARQ